MKKKWMWMAMVLVGMLASSSQAGLLEEDFNAPTWDAADPVVGTNSWQQVYYYGNAQNSGVISGPLAGIGGDGFGAQIGGAAKALSSSVTSGVVTLTAKFWGNTNNQSKMQLFLGTSTLVSSDNDSIWSVIGTMDHTDPKNWHVYRNGSVDQNVQGVTSPFSSSTWYEFEISIDLDNDTATQGYYTLNQSTLARNSSLSVLATHTGVTFSSITHAGFLVGSNNMVVDDIQVVPEPMTLGLLGIGGGLMMLRRKRM